MPTASKTEAQTKLEVLPYLALYESRIAGPVVLMADGSYGVGWEIASYDLTIFDEKMIDDLETQIVRLIHSLPHGSVPMEKDPDHGRLGAYFQIINQRVSEFSDVFGRLRSMRTDSGQGLAREIAMEQVRLMETLAREGSFVRRRVFLLMRYYPDRTTGRRPWWPVSYLHFDLSLSSTRRILRERTMRALRNEIGVVEGVMASSSLSPRRLDTDELFHMLYRAFNPATPAGNIAPDPRQTLRSQVLGDFEPGKMLFKLDGLWHAVVTLRSMPAEIGSCGGALFQAADGDVIMNINAYPAHIAEKFLEGAKRKNRLNTGKEGKLAAAELEQAIAMAKAGQAFANASWHVVLRDEDPHALETKIRNTIRLFSDIHGMEGRLERYSSPVIFFSMCVPFASSPLTERLNRRNKIVAVPWAANLAPVFGPYSGTATRPVFLAPTATNPPNLFTFDPFDETQPSWNTMILGAPGAGKTTLILRIMLSLALYNPLVFIVDRKGSFAWIARLLGGRHYRITPGNPVCINPFDVGDGRPDGTEAQREQWHHHTNFIATFLRILADGIAPDEEGAASRAVQRLFAARDYQPFTMSDLIGELREREGEAGARLATRLAAFSREGTHGAFFDGEGQLALDDASFVSADLGALMDVPRLGTAYFMALDHLFARRAAREPGRNHVYVYDEAWAFLDNPHARRTLEAKNRLLRALGGAVWYADQAISTFQRTEEGQAIIGTTTNWFILQLQHQEAERLREVGFTEREVQIVKALRTEPGRFARAYARTVRNGLPLGAVLETITAPMLYAVMTNDALDAQVRQAILREIAGTDDEAGATVEELQQAIRRFAHLLPQGTRPLMPRIRAMQEKYPDMPLLDIIRSIVEQ